MLAIAFICALLISNAELVSVIEITIPGAASPVLDIPPNEVYEEGLNDITPIGLRQHYVLGYYHKIKWARAFLDQAYNGNQFYARSTNTNSSIQSAYAHTMGIYPFNPSFTLDPNQIQLARPPVFNDTSFPYVEKLLGSYPLPFKFYPIPTHVFDPYTDPLSMHSCHAANLQQHKEFTESEAVGAIFTQYTSTINEVLTTYGFDRSYAERSKWLKLLLDILAADFDARHTGLHTTVLASLHEMADKLIPWYYYGNPESNTAKIRAHQFNDLLIDVLDDVVGDYLHKSKEERRAYTLYMTADNVMASLLKSWGIPSDKVIPYASYILINVNRKDEHEATTEDDFSVVATYAHEKGKAADPILMCGANCKIKDFLAALEKAKVPNVKNVTELCGQSS